jgi:PBP1b-binding outer membrane lipoprotein LpoB
MKRIGVTLLIILLLTGCSAQARYRKHIRKRGPVPKAKGESRIPNTQDLLYTGRELKKQ